jgi:tetratricopeptide (TPR) repeat protein
MTSVSFISLIIAAIAGLVSIIVYVVLHIHKRYLKRNELHNLMSKARILAEKGKTAEAMAIYNNPKLRDMVKNAADQAFFEYQQGIGLYHLAKAGNKLENLKQSLQLLERAAAMYRQMNKGFKYAAVLNDLAQAHILFSGVENQNDHLLQARDYLEEAVKILARRAKNPLYAAVRYNLAYTFHGLFQTETAKRREYLKQAIAAFEAVLELYHPASHPLNHAMALLNLSACYKDLSQYENSLPNLKKALEIAELSLKSITRTQDPFNYGRLQTTLGQVYFRLADYEEQRRNIRSSYRAFKKALRVYRPVDSPVEYARIHYEISKIHCFYGEIAGKIKYWRQALHSIHEALKIFNPDSQPYSYATCHLKEGAIHIRMAEQENREDNLISALNAFESALKVYSTKDEPEIITTAQLNLGLVRYWLADFYDPETNLREAVRALETAIRTDKFATRNEANQARFYLGHAYHKLALENPTPENLTVAVQTYQSIAGLYNPDEAPAEYAATHSQLGKALQDLAKVKDPEANQTAATVAFEHALEALAHLGDTTGEATVSTDLGKAHLELFQFDKSPHHLDQAATLFSNAQKLYGSASQPFEQALAQLNQGIAYRLMAREQERLPNLNKAIQTFQTALKIFTPDENPENCAIANYQLGLTYRDLSEFHETEYNLTRAARSFEKALEQKEEKPDSETTEMQCEYAKVLMKLAEYGNASSNLLHAIELFEANLKYYLSPGQSEEYGMLLNHLGICYLNLSESSPLNKTDNLNNAVQILESALAAFSPGKAPSDYAMVQNNLGTAYSRLAAETDRKINFEKALHAFEMALQIYHSGTYPEEYNKVKTNLEKLKTRLKERL